MTDNHDLPVLRILPVEALVLHEYFDVQRTPPIVESIKSSGVLRNPPIVVPMEDDTERYMVIDGANRTTAFQSLGLPHILVQVVASDNPGLNLSSWNHVIWGVSPDDLLHGIMDIPHLALQPTDSAQVSRTLMDVHSVAVLNCPNGDTYDLRTARLMFLHHIEILNEVVNSYAARASLDRTQLTDLTSFQHNYPELSGLLIMPSFRIDQILQAVRQGQFMPPGSTRFTISPRALRLNYPLEKLAAQKSLQEKNAELQTWVQECLSKKRLRYYAEATYLFDE
ncbi:MAG: ParB N-terminal domain-containing protein [Anaerolineales bacterium]|nr:ParB N-terminal domain-containing protein [Chloroflexota bacterium]MBL6980294.1 ParB N-terminal domain-containing protein [Anaerolineales bacterium]